MYKFFSKKQTGATETKIRIYKSYMRIYLIKVLMWFGSVLVGDLFCGPGKHSSKDGSPLALIGCANEALQVQAIEDRWKELDGPKLYIFFSDKEAEHINDLKKTIENLDDKLDSHINILDPHRLDFLDALKEIEKYKNMDCGKFFFLDPYNYSTCDLSAIKKILNFKFSEILLFIPSSFIQRFSGSSTATKIKALIKFVNEFADGNIKYSSVEALNDCILNNFYKKFKDIYASYIEIKSKSNKNTLFFITKNIHGAILMNTLRWKEADDGKLVDDLQTKGNLKLLDKDELERMTVEVKSFNEKLESKIQKNNLTNQEIINFTVKEGKRLNHATDLLKKLKKYDKIRVVYLTKEKTRGFYVSEENIKNNLCIIKYKQ
jgi:three-Cys-motif partner protein